MKRDNVKPREKITDEVNQAKEVLKAQINAVVKQYESAEARDQDILKDMFKIENPFFRVTHIDSKITYHESFAEPKQGAAS